MSNWAKPTWAKRPTDYTIEFTRNLFRFKQNSSIRLSDGIKSAAYRVAGREKACPCSGSLASIQLLKLPLNKSETNNKQVLPGTANCLKDNEGWALAQPSSFSVSKVINEIQ